MGVVASFPLEKSLYVRERAAGSYYTSAYFFAKSFSELPLNVWPHFSHTKKSSYFFLRNLMEKGLKNWSLKLDIPLRSAFAFFLVFVLFVGCSFCFLPSSEPSFIGFGLYFFCFVYIFSLNLTVCISNFMKGYLCVSLWWGEGRLVRPILISRVAYVCIDCMPSHVDEWTANGCCQVLHLHLHPFVGCKCRPESRIIYFGYLSFSSNDECDCSSHHGYDGVTNEASVRVGRES